MPTTGAQVAKGSRANLAAGGSLGPTGMLPLAERRGRWRAQWSTHLPGTSCGDTTSTHPSSPIRPPTRKALIPEEVQELLGATGGAGGNHVPSSERLAATSLHGPSPALHPRLQKPLWLEWESRLCCSGEGRLWIPRLACLMSLHLLIASGTGQRHQPLYSVRPLELRLPSLQQGESRLPETWERGPQSPPPFSPSPLTMATALHICMRLWPRWAP